MNKAPKLQFPPDISVERQGKTYVIFRIGVGEICGVVLSETPLQPYLKVKLDSNKTIVASVAQKMSFSEDNCILVKSRLYFPQPRCQL
ncbi:hypothetical protein FM037_13385 [Shewanella psychropiezotolerans]|uniref:Uncharacterized protein n=1 Tax=Shewanella psychropiezotolerans TaxID=2593655 RepID=A0ABX5WY83_9GAMM|nr:hypothetical protein [Shewanella psychropiezotolerans]QDO84050.1 hypothetical protein FM037_13385 [Shewanella psychropiezotolerans]